MYAIPSSLTSQEKYYNSVKETLSPHGFGLGGNWDYDHGSFDCALDDVSKVWLRLPFDVIVGRLDDGAEQGSTIIRFGQPFVLKHVYNEGLDREAQPRALGGLIDQFSDPIDADGQVESHWVETARQKLNEVEGLYSE